jgi:hypothetical protein
MRNCGWVPIYEASAIEHGPPSGSENALFAFAESLEAFLTHRLTISNQPSGSRFESSPSLRVKPQMSKSAKPDPQQIC